MAMQPAPIDMEAVADELRRRGVHSYVEQTGGGVATIYAGPQHEEPGWGTRWACLAGPGWFDGPLWTLPVGDLGDFYVGPDDDGETEPLRTKREHTVADVADLIESVIRRGVEDSTFGHCDTCGAPCGPDGCSADSRHPVALSHDDQQPRMTNEEQT